LSLLVSDLSLPHMQVCGVRTKETETMAVQLAKHDHGHKVIMSMLEVRF
jgi:hypothetical protein